MLCKLLSCRDRDNILGLFIISFINAVPNISFNYNSQLLSSLENITYDTLIGTFDYVMYEQCNLYKRIL